MASWQEIETVRKDPAQARFIAGLQLKHGADGLTDWEIGFLRDLADRSGEVELSTRQAEVLLDIRDNVERVATCGGFSVARLVQGCFEARDDLSEADEAWIVELRRLSPERIRRRQARRLLGCARALGLVERYVDV